MARILRTGMDLGRRVLHLVVDELQLRFVVVGVRSGPDRRNEVKGKQLVEGNCFLFVFKNKPSLCRVNSQLDPVASASQDFGVFGHLWAPMYCLYFIDITNFEIPDILRRGPSTLLLHYLGKAWPCR